MQEPEIARPRDRSQSAENRRQEMKIMNHTDTQMKKIIDTQMNVKEVVSTARERAFENSTLRQSSRFERVLIETTTSDEMMNMKTTLAVYRANPASGRKRGRRRERERERKGRGRRKERERRERRQAVSE